MAVFGQRTTTQEPEPLRRPAFGVRPVKPVREKKAEKEDKVSRKKHSGQAKLPLAEGNLARKAEPDVEASEDQISFSGVLETVRYFKEESSWGIFLIRDAQETLHVVRGVLERPHPGMDVTGFGKFVRDPQYGLQFDAKMLSESLPEETSWQDRDRVFASLRSLPHLTEKRFGVLWDRYGADLRGKLGDSKAVSQALPKVPKAHREELVSAYLGRGKLEKLYWFVSKLGGGQGVIRYIIKHYDERFEPGNWDVNAVVARYQQNPYRLLEIRGLGFLMVDSMALHFGVLPDSPDRLRSALRFVLAEKVQEQGNTALEFSRWPDLALGPDVLRVEEADAPKIRKSLLVEMEKLVRDGKVAVWKGVDEAGHPVRYVADRRIHQAESLIAEHLREMSVADQSPMLPLPVLEQVAEEDGLSFLQRKALQEALRGRVGILTGGPGTGKTTCMRSVLRAASRLGKVVALCAPTGKAASRLKTVAQMSAVTIHSLIGKRPGHAPVYNQENPYSADLFVVDEVSMVDTELMADLLGAIPVDACLLLVGDIWQLPSVGPGQVLSDLVHSRRFRVGVLTENFRQREDPIAGQIPAAAHRVNSGILEGLLESWGPGKTPKSFSGYCGYAVDDSGEAADAGLVSQEIVRIVEQALASGVHPNDLQVLTAMRKHALGVGQLNRALQPVLNTKGVQKAGLVLGKTRSGEEPWTWHMGDRVILKRNYRDFQVFNGDGGTVVGLYPSWKTVPEKVAAFLGWTQSNFAPCILVRFAVPMNPEDWETVRQTLVDGEAFPALDERGEPCVLMSFTRDTVKDLEPAYALTIHKTQGSEYPYVILVLHTQHWVLCNRPLLYTGMTRAKKGLLLLGATKAVRQAIRNPGNRRLTLLRYFLRDFA